MSAEQILKLVKAGKLAGCSEVLITLGEKPEAVHPKVKEELEKLGYKSTVDYLESICQHVLKLGLLPHVNAGVLRKPELKQLRQWSASMGLMLESIADLPAHALSPGKKPALRLQMIKAAGELHIPFTTGLLIGIGETFEDRVRSLLAIRRLHERYGHIQEVIIQPFAPKPNTPMANWPSPSAAELLETVAVARRLMPGMNIQVPPNLVGDGGAAQRGLDEAVRAALLAGANDLGGVSPLTPDYINPEAPWPSIQELRAAIRRAGFVPRERLPIYPRYAKDPRFMSKEVKERVRELADEDGYRAG